MSWITTDFTLGDLEINLTSKWPEQQRQPGGTAGMFCGCSYNCIITWLLITSCVVLSRSTESAPCIETEWRPLHPTTAAVRTMMRTTPLNGWYPALAVPSYTMPCRSVWLNTRTGVCARNRSRLSKTAWWTSKSPGKNSWWSSTSQPPLRLRPAELNAHTHTHTGWGVLRTCSRWKDCT